MAGSGAETTRPGDRSSQDKPESVARETLPRRQKPSERESALLRVRRRVERRRPEFRREESWRYAKLDKSWRRPRGGSSKMRLQAKGWPAIVKVGHRGPRAVRSLHAKGLHEVLVHTENELQKLDPEREAVRVAHTVGARRRARIVEKAGSLQLTVVNPGGEAKEALAPEEKQEA